MTKKVLYVWQHVFPWDVRVDKITRTLASAGYEVGLFSRADAHQKDFRDADGGLGQKIGDVRFFPWKSRWSAPLPGSPAWIHALKTCLQQFPADLIIARDILVAPAAIRVAQQLGLPVLIDMAEHYPAAMRGWAKYNRNRLSRFAMHDLKVPDHVEKLVIQNATALIAVCDENLERVQKIRGNKSWQTAIVGNTPEIETFAGVRKGTRESPSVLAHHGHMTPERGLDVLLRAFSIVIKSGHHVRLVLAGAGPLEAEIREIVKREQLDSHVQLTGRFLPSELPSLLSDMDIGLLPYPATDLINHTLSNKIFDYLACGKPVLVSATRPMERIVRESQAGMVADIQTPVTLANGIISILQADLRTMSKNAELIAESKYNWNFDRANLLRIVQNLI